MRVEVKVKEDGDTTLQGFFNWPECTVELGPRLQDIVVDLDTKQIHYDFINDDENLISIEETNKNEADNIITKTFRSFIKPQTKHNYITPIATEEPKVHHNLRDDNYVRLEKLPYSYSLNEQISIGFDQIKKTIKDIRNERYEPFEDENNSESEEEIPDPGDDAYLDYAMDHGLLIKEEQKKGIIDKWLLRLKKRRIAPVMPKAPRAQVSEVKNSTFLTWDKCP